MDDNPSPNFISKIFQKIAGNHVPENTEQLHQLLQSLASQNILDGDTLIRCENSIKFNQLQVRDVMLSRAQMDVVKTTDSMERIIAYAIDTAHSRFPVIEADKDHVIGILHAKDLLKFTQHPDAFKLEHILRPAVFVPESKSLNILLKEFQTQRNHMAIVVDEYGGISGLITFEDVIEQIVGKIADEFDEDDGADNIFPVSAERWRIKATTKIEYINAYFGTAFRDEEVDTIGGLVIQELRHLPVRGEKVVLGDLLFNVARADNRRLHTLMASKIKELKD